MSGAADDATRRFMHPKCRTCPDGHGLRWADAGLDSREDHFFCNGCLSDEVTGAFRCRPCDYDVCAACAMPNGRGVTCLGNHLLRWTPAQATGYPYVRPSCTACRTDINHGYRCDPCSFDLCVDCYGEQTPAPGYATRDSTFADFTDCVPRARSPPLPPPVVMPTAPPSRDGDGAALPPPGATVPHPAREADVGIDANLRRLADLTATRELVAREVAAGMAREVAAYQGQARELVAHEIETMLRSRLSDPKASNALSSAGAAGVLAAPPSSNVQSQSAVHEFESVSTVEPVDSIGVNAVGAAGPAAVPQSPSSAQLPTVGGLHAMSTPALVALLRAHRIAPPITAFCEAHLIDGAHLLDTERGLLPTLRAASDPPMLELHLRRLADLLERILAADVVFSV